MVIISDLFIGHPSFWASLCPFPIEAFSQKIISTLKKIIQYKITG